MSDETKARELADRQGLICPDLCNDHPHCSCGVTESAIISVLCEVRQEGREKALRESAKIVRQGPGVFRKSDEGPNVLDYVAGLRSIEQSILAAIDKPADATSDAPR